MSAVLETEIVTTSRAYRDYSSEFKAQAITLVKSNDGNVYRSAKELEIDESLLRVWMKHEDRYRNFSERKQVELATKFEYNLHRLTDDMADADLSLVPFTAKATAIGILTDKMQLLRGQPTSISEVREVDAGAVLDLLLASVNPVIDVTPDDS